MFSKVFLIALSAIAGTNGYTGRPNTYGSRTYVNAGTRQAVDTVRDPGSTQSDRFGAVQDLSERVDGVHNRASDSMIGVDVRSNVDSVTGGTAETVIRDRTTGTILASSETRTIGDNQAGSTITRVADTDRDRSAVVGVADARSFGDGGVASSSGGFYATGTCDFTDIQITSYTTTGLSEAFTNAYTSLDCCKPECVGRPLSVVFVVDESGSISSSEFDQVKLFLSEIVLKTDPQSKFGYAYVEFSSQTEVSWGFESGQDAFTLLMSESQIGGFTDIGSGVVLGLSVLDTAPTNTERVLVVLTDGKSNRGLGDPCQGHPLTAIPEVVVPADVSVFTVNVGADAKPEATDCLAKQQFSVDNFDQLNLVIEDLVLSICA